MKIEKCSCGCGESLNNKNAKYILSELTMVGYIDHKFVSQKCLIRWIYKKFNGIIKKMQI